MQLKREVENKDNPLKDNIWLRLTEENLTKAGEKLWEYICSKKNVICLKYYHCSSSLQEARLSFRKSCLEIVIIERQMGGNEDLILGCYEQKKGRDSDFLQLLLCKY